MLKSWFFGLFDKNRDLFPTLVLSPIYIRADETENPQSSAYVRILHIRFTPARYDNFAPETIHITT